MALSVLMSWLLYNLLLHVDHRRWYRKFTVSTLLDKLSETRYWVQCIIINIIINDPAFSNNSYPLIYQPVLTIWLHCTSGLSYYFSLTTPRQSNSSTSFFLTCQVENSHQSYEWIGNKHYSKIDCVTWALKATWRRQFLH